MGVIVAPFSAAGGVVRALLGFSAAAAAAAASTGLLIWRPPPFPQCPPRSPAPARPRHLLLLSKLAQIFVSSNAVSRAAGFFDLRAGLRVAGFFNVDSTGVSMSS